VSLTLYRAPFSSDPAGDLNFPRPERFVYIEPLRRRVRGIKAGMTVIDSDDVRLIHESDRLPRYLFPEKHVQVEVTEHPDAPGHVTVAWDAVDAWYEEDERVFVHPRDPYHRIDTYATSRLVEARLGETLLASSTRTKALYETGLPIRYYFRPSDVRTAVLEPSDTVTECAYKGTARHWSARVDGELVADVGWSYGDDAVYRDGEPVRGLIAFYNERVDLAVDGTAVERPRTTWSR
jgi:uncharacterized protein (DUF427 family)